MSHTLSLTHDCNGGLRSSLPAVPVAASSLPAGTASHLLQRGDAAARRDGCPALQRQCPRRQTAWQSLVLLTVPKGSAHRQHRFVTGLNTQTSSASKQPAEFNK